MTLTEDETLLVAEPDGQRDWRLCLLLDRVAEHFNGMICGERAEYEPWKIVQRMGRE